MPRMPGEKYTQARQAQARETRKKQYKQYDMFERDPKARKFYNSMAWRNARAAYIQRHPLCEDYERIKVWFPLVETSIKQGEFFPEKYGGQ